MIVDRLDKDQATAIASTLDLEAIRLRVRLTNRLRTEGTESLLAAARSAGVHKFPVQSYTGWPNERQGGRVKSEVDALDSNPPKAMTKSWKRSACSRS